MLYYERIDVFEGIDIISSRSKECDICHYWHFLDKGFQQSFNKMSGMVVMMY